jgi:NADH-quinone oxidoreductase subunit L
MEAPAPASALIHSATLVSAGIYVILRFTHIIELTPLLTNTVIIISSVTAFYGAIVAGYQSDIKRILAYSTISHCGFMMVSAILKHTTLTMYYLFVHGCFKAAAFMCVGNIIHACNNVQDTRKMGNMYKKLPFEFYALLVCLLTLSGYPLTYGYYTKHYVISILSSTNYYVENIAQFFLVLGTLVSFFYFFNFFYYTFFTFKRGKKNIYNSDFNQYKSNYYHSIRIKSNVNLVKVK